MPSDPIIDEVRRHRHEIERQCGTRERYLQLLAEIERTEQRQVRSQRPRPESKPETG